MSATRDSLRRASQWLRSAQSRSGAWGDFWTPSGISDEWVSAYVGAALARSADEDVRASARAAWRYLAGKQHTEHGWGYCARVPSDADSTAWALVLAERIGEQHSACARDALVFLGSARVEGGFTTYANVPKIRAYIEAPRSINFSGWMQPHACVTGAAALLGSLDPRLVDEMLAAQQPDGSWRSYWWFEDAYATAMSVTALASARSPQARSAVERACGWACRRLDHDTAPSSFTLSLLLAILRHGGAATQIARFTAALVAQQEPDGRWRGCARLRIPHPDATDPLSVGAWQRWCGSGLPFNIYSVDLCSVFTTATAYAAIL